MEGDSVTSSGLEWQNLALYTNKPMHIPHQFGFPSSNELYPVPDNSGRDFGIPDPTIGLRLGHQKDYGEPFSPASSRSLPSSSSIPVSSTPAKRSRASYHNMQNPRCQVEGCNLDLKLAKDYHRRHRICESHSKSPRVIVAGMERRFCQQCSRFHDLSEFDDKKRSCRRRLSDHNARRRRVQPESIQLSSPGISPALYSGTDQRQQNVLLNGLPVSLPSSTWENANTSMARHSLLRPSKVRGFEGSLNDDVLHQCLHVASNNSSMAPDLLSSHSLLSSNSWSMNEGESPSSMEGINVQGSYAAHSESDSHHLTLFQTHNVGLDHGPAPLPPSSSPMNMQNAASSHHQEYQLFKPPYHSGNFYSGERSL